MALKFCSIQEISPSLRAERTKVRGANPFHSCKGNQTRHKSNFHFPAAQAENATRLSYRTRQPRHPITEFAPATHALHPQFANIAPSDRSHFSKANLRARLLCRPGCDSRRIFPRRPNLFDRTAHAQEWQA